MQRGLVAVLALSVVLAGCSEGKKGDDVPAALIPEATDLGLKATEQTGVIVGVVLDRAFKPLADAEITIQGGTFDGLANTTNDQGAFGFDTLAAGLYVLKVTKAGYNDTTAPVEVRAGVSAPEAIKVFLDQDPSMVPMAMHQEGTLYLTGAGAPVAGSIRGPSLQGVVGGDASTQVEWEVPFGADYIVGELYWQATTPLGESAEFYCGITNLDDTSDYEYGIIVAESPAIVRFEVGKGDAYDYLYCAMWPHEGGAVGATVEQKFEVLASAFYNVAPPETWTLGADGPFPL